MHKLGKYLVVGGLAAALMLAAGCGGNDKKAPASSSKSSTKTTAQKTQKVKPVPKSPLYRYATFLDDESKVMPMTPEIIAEFEKQAKKFELPAKDTKHGIDGIWVFRSNLSKGAQINWYRWDLADTGNHATTWQEDGKKVQEQHYIHIDIRANAKDNKILSVNVSRFDVTQDTGRKGKKTELVNEKK